MGRTFTFLSPDKWRAYSNTTFAIILVTHHQLALKSHTHISLFLSCIYVLTMYKWICFMFVVTLLFGFASTLGLTSVVPDSVFGEKWKLCCWTFTYYVSYLVVFVFPLSYFSHLAVLYGTLAFVVCYLAGSMIVDPTK
jgi:hypothetical protein